MKHAIPLITILLLSPLAALNAADIYVAPGGNDEAAGTADTPVQKIQTALEKAAAGDTIMLREGTYREAVALKGKSGKEGAPITLKAYAGEKPVISGLVFMRPTWTRRKSPSCFSMANPCWKRAGRTARRMRTGTGTFSRPTPGRPLIPRGIPMARSFVRTWPRPAGMSPAHRPC